MKTNMPVFKLREVSVRRRYSEFKWLRDEVTRTVQINVPNLPGKAITSNCPSSKMMTEYLRRSSLRSAGWVLRISSTKWQATLWCW